jgi:hypothetical protein
MKSFCHRLIPFLPLFCSCQSRRLDSVQFLCYHAHILAGWHLETRLYSILLLPASELFFITTLHGPRRKHNLSIVRKACLWCVAWQRKLFDCCLRIRCRVNVFTESLPSNERLFLFRYSGFRASCHNIILILMSRTS